MAIVDYQAEAALVGDEKTELAVLWNQALEEYHRESGEDLSGTDSSRWNMGHILAEQEQQLQLFNQFRHDKSRTDKLRTFVSKNSAIIQNVATYVASAASTAFPPSAAILTAFNYVMNASKAVSEDYDMIVQFFEITHSFLERVSMLEDRVPSLPQFQKFLMNVFQSLLILSATATKCRKSHGRLKKWAKALVEGTDPKLKGAYDALHGHLQQFESTVMMATLRTAIDTSRKVDSYGKDFRAIQVGVSQTVDLGQQGLAVGNQNLAQGQKMYALEQQTHSAAVEGVGLTTKVYQQVQYVERTLSRMKKSTAQDKSDVAETKDGGSRKSAALRTLQSKIGHPDDSRDELTELEVAYVSGTFEWLSDQEFFYSVKSEQTRLLWLTGPPGMGKSTLTYIMKKALNVELDNDSGISVAHFFFRADNSSYRTVDSMISACANQVAIQDTTYREELLTNLQKTNFSWYVEKKDINKLWERFFVSKFPRDSQRRVILLLDGIDEAEDDSRKEIMNIIKHVSSSDNRIQIIFSSDPELGAELKQIDHMSFSLSKDIVQNDMEIITAARIKQLPRLRKLRSNTKRKINRKICNTADSIRYIEHTLRRLNAIGRDGPILRELSELPSSTRDLYRALLEDCQRSRTGADLAALKTFFSWLAYSRKPLSVGLATKLMNYIAKESTIVVDEEIEQRSARILRLSNASFYGSGDTDVSDNDTDNGEDNIKDGSDNDSYEDLNIFLGFQERSLRQYFCEKGEDTTGLRTPPSLGHVLVLQTVATILTTMTKNSSKSYGEWSLLQYCAEHWMKHVSEIRAEDLTPDQEARVIESLHAILSNKNNSLKKFEEAFDWPPKRSELHSAFGSSEDDHQIARKTIKYWASRATRISSSGLSSGTLEWMRPLIRNPDIIYIRMAESHVGNWFLDPQNDAQVKIPFLFAHVALERGKALLQQQAELRDYFSEREKEGENKITEKSVLVVSKSFWQMQMNMTAQCYMAIGMAMRAHDLFESSLLQFQLGLEAADDNGEKFHIYTKIAEVLIELAQKATEDETEDAINGPRPDYEQKSALQEGSSDITEGGIVESKPSDQEWVSKACDILSKALEMKPNEPHSEDPSKDVEVKTAIVTLYNMLAKAELLQGKSDNLLNYLGEAIKIPLKVKTLSTAYFTKKLAARKEWTKIIEVVAILPKEERVWFAWNDDLRLYFQQAGKESGKIDFVSNLYDEVVKTLLSWGVPSSSTSYILLPQASFYSMVVGGAEATRKAKELSLRILDISDDPDMISQASFQLANILVEEFRSTRDPNKKMLAQGEMRDLVGKMKQTMGSEFDWTQSQTSISLACMTRKLAPVEFQKLLEASFKGYISLLKDDTTGNDGQSLRLLAQVLTYMPGLERDAQIAASCQFYTVDVELQKRENESKASADKSGDSADDRASTPNAGQTTNGTKIETSNDSAEQGLDTNFSGVTRQADASLVQADDGSEKKVDCNIDNQKGEGAEKNDAIESLEDLSDSWGIFCDCCGTIIKDWKHGAIYICCYCACTDLCEKCYLDKVAREKGDLPPAWRTICPKGHKHIKAPIEGWKGIKNGMIRLKDEEFSFDEWLIGLEQKRWEQSWERFWGEVGWE